VNPLLAVLDFVLRGSGPPRTHCDDCGTKLETRGDGGLQLAGGLVLDCPKCHPENFAS